MGARNSLQVFAEFSAVANRNLMLAPHWRSCRIERVEPLGHLLRQGFERRLSLGHGFDLKRIVVQRNRACGRHYVAHSRWRVIEQVLRHRVDAQRRLLRCVRAQLHDKHAIAQLGKPQLAELGFNHGLLRTLG